MVWPHLRVITVALRQRRSERQARRLTASDSGPKTHFFLFLFPHEVGEIVAQRQASFSG